MQRIKDIGLFVIIMMTVFVHADPVWAQAAGDGTLGKVVTNTMKSFSDVPGLLTGLCYLMGVYLGILAIMKLKDHVENPGNNPMWDSMKRFLTGGAFFALPTVVEATYNTVATGITGHSDSGYNGGGAAGKGLDAMLVALMGDIGTPITYILGAFGYLAGFILIIIGISRLLKSEQDGPRGPAGIGTFMTFIVGGALIATNKMMGAASSSLFGASKVTTNGALSYTSGLEDGGAHANAVIAAIIAFVAIVGWVSFLRGFFIMRGVAEGDNQSSTMAGITHLLGGALAVNLGPVLMAVQETLGITNYGIKFN
jgi:hypothetical protein